MGQRGPGSGRRQSHASDEETRQGGRRRWHDAQVMPSAKAQVDQERQKIINEATEEYFGHPPQDEVLFELIMTKATLVIPGKQMLIPELFDPACFDAVRRAHEVWVVQEKPNNIHIHSRTLSNLKEAFREINWVIHDIRTAQNHVSSLFVVQLPIEGERPITVELDCRPQASSRSGSQQLISVQTNFHIANGLMKELGASFISSTDALQSRPNEILQMRVEFGHVKIRRRKKITQENGNANEMPYTEFAKMTSQYGKRGGADFEGKLEGSGLASNIIRHLLQPGTEFFHRHQNTTFHDTISIKLQSNTLEAEIDRMSKGSAWTNIRLLKHDNWPPLKWTILAPDRKYDWCFRVDSGINLPISPPVSDLIKSIIVNRDTHELLATTFDAHELSTAATAFLQNPVNIGIKNPQRWTDKVDQILLKSTVSIPFRDTPYVMDISVHRLWEGVDTHAYPHQSWQSVGFHGIHWAAELGMVNKTGTRKDWGVHQRHVWRGSANTAEGQFEEFVSYVLEGLSALDGI
ncbi:hypothetical protein E4U55_004463 [Claviceps digitariae]|nr:hypothetical protein E4U55_004463 [Claviceps digitariae]